MESKTTDTAWKRVSENFGDQAMSVGEMIVTIVANPTRASRIHMKECLRNEKCFRCDRTKGDDNSEETFSGEFRCGNCPKCRQQIDAETAGMSETQAAAHLAELTRIGEFASRTLLVQLRREIRREDMDAKKGAA